MSVKPDMDQWNIVLKAINDIGAPYTTGIDPLSETLTFQGVAFLAITRVFNTTITERFM